ncbi:MAG: hypothetical protein QOH41_4166 [Blastocatellia bacterium]|jgi:hypothetical protein|nr:hypothetical protein [Blastocatellia bacterium]
MSIDLVVDNAISASPQPVKDQSGNTSALQVATGIALVGQPKDNLQVLGVIATPPAGAAHIQFGNPNATAGQPSASLTFAGWGIRHAGFVWIPTGPGGSLKLAFGGFNDPNQNSTKFIFNSDGTAAFPGLPNLPASGTSDLTVDHNGNITPQTSSLRFKENVETLNEDFQKILALQPKSFTYKETGVRGIGYAAEELDELELNNLVGYDADGKPLTINYKLIPIYLLEVLKEQQKVMKELQAEVTELKLSRKE